MAMGLFSPAENAIPRFTTTKANPHGLHVRSLEAAPLIRATEEEQYKKGACSYSYT